jgi:glycosyltransferase involved in cell wall biosynthesis
MSNRAELTLLIGYKAHGIITGAGEALDLLVAGFEARGLPYSLMDLTGDREITRVGDFNLLRALDSAQNVLRVWSRLRHARRVYLAISASLPGFLRDALIIWPASFMGRDLTLHSHTSGYNDLYARQPRWLKALMRSTLGRAGHIVIEGELSRAQFSFVPHLDSRICVVPNGLPLNVTASKHAKSISPNSRLKLLFLSNMTVAKGYKDVLAACRLLKERGIPFRCDFCGDFVFFATDDDDGQTVQSAQQEFQGLIEQWTLADCVNYHGRVTGGPKLRILEEAELFLLPTYHPWESQPISIIEAMAFGTPVIATRTGGIPEQVIDGYNGFLVEARRPDQIADAVERFWRDPGMYAQFSQNAMTQFEAHFTQEAYLNGMISAILDSSSSVEETDA